MSRTGRIPGFVIVVAIFAVAAAAPMPARAQGADTKIVTFTKDVAPILQASCQGCHRPGSIAPMSLLTYQEARPYARSIKDRVVRRTMPPWHIDRTVGVQKFKNDPSLTDQQIDTIVRWVDGGAPMGDPKDMPAAKQWPRDEVWTNGQPDLIVTFPKDHVMYARGPDWFGDYLADSGLTEDRYIKAVETKPSKTGRQIVHHASTFLVQAREGPYDPAFEDPVGQGSEGQRLGQFNAGKPVEFFPADTGLLMKAGAKIRFNMHYHAIGEEIADRTSVGLYFYPKGVVPKNRLVDVNMGGSVHDLDIPPNSLATHDVYFKIAKPIRMIAYQPHMHMRGKAMSMRAILPDGKMEMLSSVDRFDFNWGGLLYTYDDDVAPLLPAGTILHFTSVHDNTTANRNNPDPAQWVGYGPRSVDEMFQCHLYVLYLQEEEFQRQVAERKAKQASAKRSGN